MNEQNTIPDIGEYPCCRASLWGNHDKKCKDFSICGKCQKDSTDIAELHHEDCSLRYQKLKSFWDNYKKSKIRTLPEFSLEEVFQLLHEQKAKIFDDFNRNLAPGRMTPTYEALIFNA